MEVLCETCLKGEGVIKETKEGEFTVHRNGLFFRIFLYKGFGQCCLVAFPSPSR